MKRQLTFLFIMIALGWSGGSAKSQTTDIEFHFDNEEVGKLPADWTAVTGAWIIAADETNKALKQVSKNPGDKFNICVESKLKFQNVEIEVRIKAIPGEEDEDQGGGLVWRYVDVKNYYIARANPVENNFRVYKVVNGKCKQLETAHVRMQNGDWFTLKVQMIGNQMECYYNGLKLLSQTDDTFNESGLVGFWSKGDAASLFDDFKIKMLK